MSRLLGFLVFPEKTLDKNLIIIDFQNVIFISLNPFLRIRVAKSLAYTVYVF